jgi:CHAD domain-containing protein
MSPYRIKRREDSADEVRRAAHERALDAVELLRDANADPVEAVHEARKNVKKLRAILRLVRPELGEATYDRENTRYRDAGRMLSDVRDAQVRADTIDALAVRFDDEPPAGGWAALRSALAGSDPRATDLEAVRAQAADAIAESDAAIDDWPLGRDGFALLRRGLRRAYSRGREGYRRARTDPTDEALHDWRKRSKDHWYHLRLLRESWPEVIGAAVDEAHELADRLGDDHDLVVLGEYLDTHPEALASPQLEHLATLAAKRRHELQSEAFAYGERLYAEKPKHFVRRIERYWNGPRV